MLFERKCSKRLNLISMLKHYMDVRGKRASESNIMEWLEELGIIIFL